METTQLLSDLSDRLAEHQVFGPPLSEAGVAVIPVAKVRGGGGIGGRTPKTPDGNGGLGFTAEPVGAFVVRGGDVSWEPAIDYNRLAVVIGGVLIAASLALRTALRRR